MKGYAGTTPTVDAIGKLGLTGNIVPRPWYQWLKFDNGKPNAVAIAIETSRENPGLLSRG